MAGILALSVSALQAENSGFYGSVGFQYSNMTRASGTNAPYGYSPLGMQQNMFANQAPGASPNLAPTPTASQNPYNTPQSGDTLCVGANCP